MAELNIVAEPGTLEIVTTYTIDAPSELVFKAHTDPELIPRWWGPRYLTTVIDKLEARPGGQWRFIQRDPEGNEYAFHGVYHDLTSPDRIVQTFEFEGAPGHVILDTITLEDLDGRTKVTTQSVFQSLAAREGMIQSGMEVGIREGMERMSELFAEVRQEFQS